MDDLTATKVQNLLRAGLGHLPKMQREIIEALYFGEIRAPKRWAWERYGLDGAQFEVEVKRELARLREWLCRRYPINGMFDIL